MVLFCGWLVFVAAIGWPSVSIVAFCLHQGGEPAEGWVMSARQLTLLWRSVWLSGVAVAACLAVSIPVGLSLADSRKRSGWIGAVAAGVLLAPPMIYAFGWGELWPHWLPNEVRCFLVWTLWAWPISAFLVGAGWSRAGRSAYESALLCVGPTRAFWHVGLPALRRQLVLSALLLFVLFFGDYSVPHACGLIVYSTELLSYASSSPRIIDTVWPALPGVALTGGILLVLYRLFRSLDDGAVDARTSDDARGTPRLAFLIMVVSILPILALAVRFGSVNALTETVKTYGTDLTWTVATALIGAALSVFMGVAIAAGRRGYTAVILGALLFGACPGAVVGVALAAAYNHVPLAFVYDHAVVLMLCFIARFGWMGMLAGMLLVRGAAKGIVEQAMTDGATRGEALLLVAAVQQFPMLAAVTSAIAALSLAELSASTVIRPPTFTPLAHLVIEKFHRFEYGMLFALCVLLVVGVIPALVFMRAMGRRWRTR